MTPIVMQIGPYRFFRAPYAQQVRVEDNALVVELQDRRTLSVPLAFFPRLLHGTPEERRNFRLIGDGEGIHWPDLDEDISIEHLLLGIPSGESAASLQRWLEKRKAR
ncbi:MAG: DUF2442 domain-containing protein [Anaerolineae bacterium]